MWGWVSLTAEWSSLWLIWIWNTCLSHLSLFPSFYSSLCISSNKFFTHKTDFPCGLFPNTLQTNTSSIISLHQYEETHSNNRWIRTNLHFSCWITCFLFAYRGVDLSLYFCKCCSSTLCAYCMYSVFLWFDCVLSCTLESYLFSLVWWICGRFVWLS